MSANGCEASCDPKQALAQPLSVALVWLYAALLAGPGRLEVEQF
jgi:hypothetical protein